MRTIHVGAAASTDPRLRYQCFADVGVLADAVEASNLKRLRPLDHAQMMLARHKKSGDADTIAKWKQKVKDAQATSPCEKLATAFLARDLGHQALGTALCDKGENHCRHLPGPVLYSGSHISRGLSWYLG